MGSTQKDQIFQSCRPAVRPVDEVMAVAPYGYPVATIEAAVMVAWRARPPRRWRNRPGRVPDFVLQLSMLEDPRNGRIAGMSAHGFSGNRTTALELAGWRTGGPGEGCDAGSDDQLGPAASAVLGLAPRSIAAYVNECVGAPLTRRARVVPRWQHERANGVADDGSGFRIDQSVDANGAIKWFADMQIAPLVGAVRLGQDGTRVDPVLEVLGQAGELPRIRRYGRPQELGLLFANRSHAHML